MGDPIFDLEPEKIACPSMPAAMVAHVARHLPRPPRVIEVGGAYGVQLPFYAGLCAHVTSVDAMYDWVPDVSEAAGHEPGRVDARKVESFRRNAEPFGDRVRLIVGNSFQVHADPANAADLADADILVVDGCHSPAAAVEKDFWNYERFMVRPCYYAVFDDMQFTAPQAAARAVVETLRRTYDVETVDRRNSHGVSARLLRVTVRR